MSVVGGNAYKSKVSSGTEMSKNLGDKQLTIWRNLESTVLIIRKMEIRRGSPASIIYVWAAYVTFALNHVIASDFNENHVSGINFCFKSWFGFRFLLGIMLWASTFP